MIEISLSYTKRNFYKMCLKKTVSSKQQSIFISKDSHEILNSIKDAYHNDLNNYQSNKRVVVRGFLTLLSFSTFSLSSRKTISLVFPKFWKGIKDKYKMAFPKFYSHPIGKIIDELPINYQKELNENKKNVNEVTVQDVIDCMQSELSETYWSKCHDSKSFLALSDKCDEIINNVFLKTFFQMAISLNRFNCIFDNLLTIYGYKGTLMDSSIKHVFTASKMSEILAIDSVGEKDLKVSKGSNVEFHDFSKYLGKFITYNDIKSLNGGIEQKTLINRIRLSGFEFFTGQGNNTGTTQPILFT